MHKNLLVEQTEGKGEEPRADLLHLPEDDAALPLDRVVRELGILQDVGEHVDGDGHVLGLNVGEEGGLLARGVGVEPGAHVLDLLLEGAGGAAAGALEDHVFEEMGGAVGTGGLEATAGIDPDADRRSVGGGNGGRLGDDADAAGEGGVADLGEAQKGGVVEGRPGVGGAVAEEARVRRRLFGKTWAGREREVAGADGGREGGVEFPPKARERKRHEEKLWFVRFWLSKRAI